MNYQAYLQTEHWRLLRGAKLQISPKCEKCPAKTELEVHHRLYRASWYDTQLRDLQTLCHGCHIEEHAKDWEPSRTKPAFLARIAAAERAKIEQERQAKRDAAIRAVHKGKPPEPPRKKKIGRWRRLKPQIEALNKEPVPFKISVSPFD